MCTYLHIYKHANTHTHICVHTYTHIHTTHTQSLTHENLGLIQPNEGDRQIINKESKYLMFR